MNIFKEVSEALNQDGRKLIGRPDLVILPLVVFFSGDFMNRRSLSQHSEFKCRNKKI